MVTSLRRHLDTLRRSISMLGFGITLRNVLIHLLVYRAHRDVRFDRRYGTDTAGEVIPADLDVANDDTRSQAIRYWPTPAKLDHYLLGSLDIEFEESAFVDFGSGKGRVLLVASDYPFDEIIGVELSPRLNEIASRNVALYRSSRQRCSRISLHCIDAAEFAIPDHAAVFHFYHPFKAPTLEKVIEQIESSLRKNPREIRIIYIHHVAAAAEVFARFPFLRVEREMTCVDDFWDSAIYANTWDGDSGPA